MSSNTKTRLLKDLESLRHQLAELEAYDANPELTPSNIEAITSLDADNIPLLGDAVLIDPVSREEAISVRREALAHLDSALKELEGEGGDLQATPEKGDSAAQNAVEIPTSDEHITQGSALGKFAHEDALLNDTDLLEHTMSESDILDINELDDEDPLSPPPNLSAHIQSESLILEIPTKQDPTEAMGESADSLSTQSTQIDLMQMPTLEDRIDEESNTVEESTLENLIKSKPEPEKFASAYSLSSNPAPSHPAPSNPAPSFSESAFEASQEEARPASKPETHQINSEIASSPEITSSPENASTRVEANNPPINEAVKPSVFSQKPLGSFADTSKPIEPKATTLAHNTDSPETPEANITNNNELPAFLQAENIMMNTTKDQPLPEPTSLQANAEDNPFLPQYLRERLSKSKSSLLEEIARSSESLNASTALLRNFGGRSHSTHSGSHASSQKTQGVNTSPEHQAIVDHLVAKYLPIIEADLRQRLHSSIKQQTTSNQTTNSHLTSETT